MSGTAPPLAPGGAEGVVLYDGGCGLCAAWAGFVAARDRAGRFRFVALQAPEGRALAAALGIDAADPDTLAVLLGGRVRLRSDGVLAAMAALPGWRWIGGLAWLPRGLRDRVYRLVARNRHRLPGAAAACRWPPR